MNALAAKTPATPKRALASRVLTRVELLMHTCRGRTPIYGDRTAGRTLHLFELLEAVHDAGIPTISLKEVVQRITSPAGRSLESVKMHPRLTGSGSGSVAEMAALATITAAKQPLQILEFGTHEGCSTWHLAANAPPAAVVTTLDLPANHKVHGSTDNGLQGVARRPFLPADERIRLIEIDSRQWEPRCEGPIDLCFIDAGHSYECVKSDTEKALPLMADDGIVLWHDAAWQRDGYGVNRYLKELCSQGRNVQLVRVGAYDYSALAILFVGQDGPIAQNFRQTPACCAGAGA